MRCLVSVRGGRKRVGGGDFAISGDRYVALSRISQLELPYVLQPKELIR